MTRGLMRKVAALVAQRGATTLDDLEPHFPGLTRHQLHHALSNAQGLGLVRCAFKGRKGPQEPGKLTVWEPGAGEKPTRAPRTTMPARSVFELGEPVQAGTWPPQGLQGRQFAPLGGWSTAPEPNNQEN